MYGVAATRFLRVGAFVFGLAAIAGCSSKAFSPPGASDLANPPEVVSSGGAVSLTLTAVINPSTGAPAISFNGMLVAPTIRISPGETINLTYINALPASSGLPANTVNLHFHGFSGSPNPPADDAIGTLAMPGQTLHYQIVIPATQPPGLYLYHSHAHGEASWQLYNGMAGAIIVNGLASIAPETAGLPERVIILRNALRNPSFSALSNDRRTAEQTRPTAGVVSTVCMQPLTTEYTTINGVGVGTPILMQPGKQQLWRVINAAANAYYDVSVDGQNLHLVGLDGVPLLTYPGASEINVHDLVIPPASRAEFIVTGPASGTTDFRTTCTDTGFSGSPNPPQVLGVVAAGTPNLPVVPRPGSTPRATGTYDRAVGAPAVQRTLDFTENPHTGQYYLNGQLYGPSGPPMFTATAGTVEEWTLSNASAEVHTFHIHQVHFIVLDIDGVAQPPMWRDSINLPYFHPDGTASVTHVLIDFRDPAIRGTFLFHCHLLKHEDAGMMAKITVR